ncbi:MAG: type II and III secretion system protein family protein [Blastocatellales bacterium]
MTNQIRRSNVQPVLRLAISLLVLFAFGISANAQERTVQASFATGNTQPIKIDVLVGQSRVIEFNEDYERLSISDPKIAEVVPINYKQALVNGLTFGQVNLVAWAKRKPGDPERMVVFDIYVQVNLSLIDNQIKILFPKENIQLSQANNSVVLSGSVTKPELADQVQKIIEAAGLKVTNLLKGPVLDAAQVQLQIRVAEVNRKIMREVSTAYGFNNSTIPTFVSSGGPGVGDATSILRDPNSPTGTAAATGLANFLLGIPSSSLGPQAFVRALYQRGALRDLAEPNLIAMHGQKASFLAGGEFPIPVIQNVNQGQTAITVIFKEFGVKLDFTPTIIDENHIRLELAPEVSSLDFASGVSIQSLVIPGLRVRRAKTVLELRDGQSFALAGLIDNNEQVNLSKVPLLGDIPILGELFKSRSFQRNETELLFLATVKLVEPLNPDQLPRLPGVSELKPVTPNPTVPGAAGQIEGQSGHSVPRKSGEDNDEQSSNQGGNQVEAGKIESVVGAAAQAKNTNQVAVSSVAVPNVEPAANAAGNNSASLKTPLNPTLVGPTGADVTVKSGKTGKAETAKQETKPDSKDQPPSQNNEKQ